MGFRSDNAFENELTMMLSYLEQVKKDITLIMGSHKIMPIKDKALLIQKIHKHFTTINSFILRTKKEKILSTGVGFKLENVKAKSQSLANLWRKVEDTL